MQSLTALTCVTFFSGLGSSAGSMPKGLTGSELSKIALGGNNRENQAYKDKIKVWK